MARRRRTSPRTKTRTVYRKAPRRRSSRRGSSSSKKQDMMRIGASMLYGFGRPYIEQAIQPITSKIPIAGQYVDELTLGLGAYYGLKKTRSPFLKAARDTILTIESARAGSGLGQQLLNN